MANYRIKEESLTAIGDRVRQMAKISDKLSLEEMVYWLGRLRAIALAWVDADISLPALDLTTTVENA